MRMAGASASRAVEMGANFGQVRSPETYIGFARADRFVSPGGLSRNEVKAYSIPPKLDLNDWALGGSWTVGAQAGMANAGGAKIAFRFHARDLHLVLGPAPGGKPVRFRIRIDGRAPGADAGADVNADGSGVVSAEGLYQLVRQKGEVRDRTFEIEFLDPGVRAFSFTFG